MQDILIKNASELLTCRSNGPKTKENLDDLGIIENGYLAVKDGKIAAIGDMSEINSEKKYATYMPVNAAGKVVMPGFIDCHTHLVFAGSREDEFEQNIKGKSYFEALENGGGIPSTVAKTRKALLPDNHLSFFRKLCASLDMVLDYGTTTIEIKSGYGLALESEMGILKILKWLQSPCIDIVPTFLGAHAVPTEFKDNGAGYVEQVLQMIDMVGREGLAEYCDIFLESGAFSLSEAIAILWRAKLRGLKLKLHASQFSDIGGVELGTGVGAVSIDHLDYISKKGMKLMEEKKTIGVLLPSVSFHLMLRHYAPARKMIEAGVPIALATDFNPGTSPTFSMQMIIALACRQMRLTAAQAINAVTINAAYALDRGHEIGSLEVGKKADIIILDVPNHKQIPYWFGGNLVEKVIKNGRIVK